MHCRAGRIWNIWREWQPGTPLKYDVLNKRLSFNYYIYTTNHRADSCISIWEYLQCYWYINDNNFIRTLGFCPKTYIQRIGCLSCHRGVFLIIFIFCGKTLLFVFCINLKKKYFENFVMTDNFHVGFTCFCIFQITNNLQKGQSIL